MNIKRKLPWLLTGKGLMATLSVLAVAIALVSYTATVTININSSFTVGATTATWDVYLNDVAQLRYLPGSTATPRGSAELGSGTTNNAFSVVDDGAQGTAVNITLTTLMSATQFSQFQITVKQWNATSSSWQAGTPLSTLYTTQTGTTTMTFIQGLSGGAGQTFGFLHILKTQTTTVYFEIVVTYTVNATSAGTATAVFSYTPTRTSAF